MIIGRVVLGGKGGASYKGSILGMTDEMITENMTARGGWSHVATAVGGYRVGDVYVSEEGLMPYPAMPTARQIEESAVWLNTLATDYDVPVCVAVVPEASEFYLEERIGKMVGDSGETAIRDFYAGLDMTIREIDVYSVLSTMTDSYIYNRTDSRLTCYGTYCVYRAITQQLGFVPIRYDQYSITHVGQFYGNLYEKCPDSRVTADILDRYTNKEGAQVLSMVAYLEDGNSEKREMYTRVDSDDPYAYYLGEACAKIELETDVDNDKKLLLLTDEYGACMVPFLCEHYSEICVRDMRYSLDEKENINAYDQVIVLCGVEEMGTIATLW